MKTAIITGVTGQDGRYLAELLLEKKYRVIGLARRVSTEINNERLQQFLKSDSFHVEFGDLADGVFLNQLIRSYQPDEVYNLGAMSHVGASFNQPEYTANVDALGALRILEAIRNNGLADKTKFYQASTSELYGKVKAIPQNESTPFHPRSPYAVAKMYAYWITVNYRESYGMFACNGLLFNHESPLRGSDFVTRKITLGAAAIAKKKQEVLRLGNLDAKRDWGYAKDYVEGMWLMLQARKPDDYVLATGVSTTVRDFTTLAFEYAGIELEWKGRAGTIEEYAVDKSTGERKVEVDKTFFRPAEVEYLLGDASKAREMLGWEPKVDVMELCKLMVESDLKLFS